MVETALATRPNGNGAGGEMALIEQVLIIGDLSKLNSHARAEYYAKVCHSIGLNPLTRPFDYLTLNGKMILYARKDATDQLRTLRNVSVAITSAQTVGDLYVVTATATLPNGRSDAEIGAVAVAGLRGDALANAMMKATTKAKRRVTLSICGLGLLDETELDTIPYAQRGAIEGSSGREVDTATGEITERPPSTEAEKDEALVIFGAVDLPDSQPEPIDKLGTTLAEFAEETPLRGECRSIFGKMQRFSSFAAVPLPSEEAPESKWSEWLTLWSENLKTAEKAAERRAGQARQPAR